MAQSDTDDFPLLKYLDELVDKLREMMSPAIRGEDADAVHDARVATRRLKAATDLLDPVVAGRCRKPFEKVAKCLRKQLGPLRDLDVMLEHLGESRLARFDAGRQWLADRLGERRIEALELAQDEAPPTRMLARLGTWWGLRQEILEARESIGDLLAESVHLQLDAFAEQANELIHSSRNDPHQLRIAGKSLRYTLEMAKEHGVRLPASIMSLFKRMQTALGLWHDYVVLSERILRESVDCDMALHDPRLQEQLLGIAQHMLRKAQQQLSKMSDLWRTHGTAMGETIRQAFPLTKHAQPEEKALSPAPEVHTPVSDRAGGTDASSAPAA